MYHPEKLPARDVDTVFENAAAEIQARAGIPRSQTEPIDWLSHNPGKITTPSASHSKEMGARQKVERRAAPRAKDRLKVVLSLVFPAETFTPYFEETQVFNISREGALSSIVAPAHVLKKLMHELHYCRLQFTGDGLPCRLLGKVVWLEPEHKDKQGSHRVGIRLEHATDEDLAKLDEYLDHKLKLQAEEISNSSNDWVLRQRVDGARFGSLPRD